MLRHIQKFLIIPVIALTMVACNSGNTEPKNVAEGDNAGENIQQSNTQSPGSADNVAVAEAIPISISEDQFAAKVFDFRNGSKWKYKGDKPCIIDFYADWCGPCRTIAPYMKEFAASYANDIYVYKVNTDHAQDLSMFFNINAIPAVMLCPMKGDFQIVVGANPKDHYDNLIKTVLLNK